MFGLVGLLVELVLPVALTSALLLVVAEKLPLWDLRSTAGLGIFAVLLVVGSLLISIRVDAFTLPRREKRGRRQLLNRTGARFRLFKFVLGGVLIPIAAFVAANRIELPGHRTPMALAIEAGAPRSPASLARSLADAIIRSREAPVKAAGIRALAATRSSEALDELVRILDDDPVVLRDGACYRALAKALASFGAAAKLKLLPRLERLSPDQRRGALPPPRDLFDRDFSGAFAAARDGIVGAHLGPAREAAVLAQLETARADLENAVGRIATNLQPASGGNGPPALILDAFLQMDLTRDAGLLAFARRIAASPEWADGIRGRALLLIAKLGDADDLPTLSRYLDGASVPLQISAMEAIARLQTRLRAGAATD